MHKKIVSVTQRVMKEAVNQKIINEIIADAWLGFFL